MLYVRAFLPLDWVPDLRACCRMCSATNQTSKSPPDVLDNDCLNTNESELSEEAQASPNEEDFGPVTSPYEPEGPSLSSPAEHTRSRLLTSLELPLNQRYILLGRLPTEKWALDESTSHSPGQTRVKTTIRTIF